MFIARLILAAVFIPLRTFCVWVDEGNAYIEGE